MDTLSPTDSLTPFPAPLIGAPVGPYAADMRLESKLAELGHHVVAGIDEAGRGPLAGPVVAAAVILDKKSVPVGLGDSKTLSSKKRWQLFGQILQNCTVSVATINAATIDQINIRQATLKCMTSAVKALSQKPDWCLIDGRDIPPDLKPYTNNNATAVIKGDGRSFSIAAASIVAKVTRDMIMVEAAKSYPGYGFEKHKGYGTRAHIEAISRHGPCPLHRLSFAPIRSA